MAQGAFIVSPHPPNDPKAREIMFNLDGSFNGPVPEDQLALQDQVERTLVVLRTLFPPGNPRFFQYFPAVLSLAQAGLVGPHAQPELGRRALAQLQDEVVTEEAGTVKKRYMAKLGYRVLILALPAIALALALGGFSLLPGLQPFLWVWAGAMVGVWLSFGIRKTALGFFDLPTLEEDRLEPTMRLLLSGLLAVFVALLLSTKVAELKVGGVDLTAFETNVRLALVLGVAAGLSEKLVGQAVAKKAAALFKF